MRKLCTIFLILAVLGTILPASAYDGGAAQKAGQELWINNFGKLVYQNYFTTAATTGTCPNDNTSTNTYSIMYCPATITPPLKLRIQNLGTSKIYYNDYSDNYTTSTLNVTIPTATCSYLTGTGAASAAAFLNAGEVKELIFLEAPDLVFGGVALATFSIEVWKRGANPYE